LSIHGFVSTVGIWFAAVIVSMHLAVAPAQATTVDLIQNGGFEFGLSGWQQFPLGDGNWFWQTGTHNPLNGFLTVPAPPGGNFAAMTDGNFPGAHILTQTIFVPSGVTSATLQFTRYVNTAPTPGASFASPNSLQFFFSFANQQARVDFMSPGSIPDSVAPADVLQNVFQTHPGDPLTSGYTVQTTDVTALLAAHPNQIMNLRFAETNNLGIFYFGIDQVSLVVTVPEPSTCTLCGVGLLAMAGLVWRRRAA